MTPANLTTTWRNPAGSAAVVQARSDLTAVT